MRGVEECSFQKEVQLPCIPPEGTSIKDPGLIINYRISLHNLSLDLKTKKYTYTIDEIDNAYVYEEAKRNLADNGWKNEILK